MVRPSNTERIVSAAALSREHAPILRDLTLAEGTGRGRPVGPPKIAYRRAVDAPMLRWQAYWFLHGLERAGHVQRDRALLHPCGLRLGYREREWLSLFARRSRPICAGSGVCRVSSVLQTETHTVSQFDEAASRHPARARHRQSA